MHLAIKLNRLECITLLLGKGALVYYENAFQRDNSPIFYAFKQKNLEPLMLLIKYSLKEIDSYQTKYETPILFHAFSLQNDTILKVLI